MRKLTDQSLKELDAEQTCQEMLAVSKKKKKEKKNLY